MGVGEAKRGERRTFQDWKKYVYMSCGKKARGQVEKVEQEEDGMCGCWGPGAGSRSRCQDEGHGWESFRSLKSVTTV